MKKKKILLMAMFILLAIFFSNAESLVFTSYGSKEIKASSDLQQFKNIALGKKVLVSSQYSSAYPAQDAVDGNKTTTAWGSSIEENPSWIFVDLESVQEINGAGLYWYNDFYPKAYSFYGSNNSTSWTKLATINKNSVTNDIFTENISIQYRYLGILCEKKNQVCYGLLELEIYRKSVTPTNTITPTTTPSPTANPSADLSFTYSTTNETAGNFTGAIVIKNPNSAYAWNGSYFVIWNFECETSSQITSVTNATYKQEGNKVIIDLGWQRFFPYNQSLTVTINGNKSGNMVYPQNFKPHYVRSEEIIYPELSGLPASWYKGKVSLSKADLIPNETEYYKKDIGVVTDNCIMYHPISQTQFVVGQPKDIGYPVNGVNKVRMRIPNKFVAMGAAFVSMEFGILPSWILAIGTKENWAAGLTQDPVAVGHDVEFDGEKYKWPIAFDHPDGPYQVEAGNFNDIVAFFPDYFAPGAKHGNYMTVSSDMNNPNWISSTITCALSLSITKELLNAAKDTKYVELMKNAIDPTAELTILTFAFNRGIGSVYERKLFTTNRQKTLQSTNICDAFDMGGFASHIPTVKAQVNAMNNELTLRYDEMVTWSDINNFLDELKTFFGNGAPSATEWSAMTSDMQKAFILLAAHWGGDKISIRYDFITLLKILRAYHPLPLHPRPTTQEWYYRVNGATP